MSQKWRLYKMCKKNSMVKDLVWSFFVALAFYPMLLAMVFWNTQASEHRFEINENIVPVIPGTLDFSLEPEVSYPGAAVVDQYPDTSGDNSKDEHVFVIATISLENGAKITDSTLINKFKQFIMKFKTDGHYVIHGAYNFSTNTLDDAYTREEYWADYYQLDEMTDLDDRIAILTLTHGREDAIGLYDALIYTGDFLWAIYYLYKAVDFIFMTTCQGGTFLQNVQDLSYHTETARDVFTQLTIEGMGKKNVLFMDEAAEILENVLDYIQEMKDNNGDVTSSGMYNAIIEGSYSHPSYKDSIQSYWTFFDYIQGTLVLWTYRTNGGFGGGFI